MGHSSGATGEGTLDMSKELFIAAHEKLMSLYLDEHPGATEAKAYDATADRAYDEMRDNLADMADRAKLRMKEEGNWPPKDKI